MLFCLHITNKNICNGQLLEVSEVRMETKEIMLVCAAGMSTSLLVTKMQKAAEERQLVAKIFAVPVPEAEEYLAQHSVDVLLLGPQVRYLLDGFKDKYPNLPAQVIPMTDYGMMKGDKVLDLAQSLMKGWAMTEEANLEVAMTLIMYGGEAKSCALEAIAAAKKQDFKEAEAKLAQGQKALLQAHHAQMEILSKEAQGQKTDYSLFMVHGQDHLMTSIAFLDLAKEIVELYQKIDK